MQARFEEKWIVFPSSAPIFLPETMASSHPDREAIEANQIEQLRSLLAELFPGNRFYSRKLNAAGITFDVANLEDFSARFPFTTKAEIVEDQRVNPPFGTNLTYPLEGYTRYHQTSGTSGAPTYAIRLAEVAAEEKIGLGKSQVRTLIVAGELGGSIPAVRARLAGLWPAVRIFDHHGMTEVGPVTYECPARPGVLHVMEGA